MNDSYVRALKYVIIISLVLSLLSVMLRLLAPNEEVINVSEPVERTINDIIVERTMLVLGSEEFQAEVRALATARALHELSLEKQDEALRLAEMAQKSHSNSRILAEAWVSAQVYE